MSRPRDPDPTEPPGPAAGERPAAAEPEGLVPEVSPDRLSELKALARQEIAARLDTRRRQRRLMRGPHGARQERSG